MKESNNRGIKVVFIAGIHIDISPEEDQLFSYGKRGWKAMLYQRLSSLTINNDI